MNIWKVGTLSFCTACSAAALSLAPAVAQETAPPDAQADIADKRLGTVTVTARKREESLQDVPMSITAVDGAALAEAGYVDLAHVQRVATNVVIQNMASDIPRIYIRGIGTRNFDLGSEQSVGIFIDGVYQARSGNLDVALLDVERVEVLKGPQGTLYGRNTIGGALSIVTRAPSDVFEGSVSGEIGRSEIDGDNFYDVTGRLSGPLTENGVLGSLVLSHRQRDGYLPVQNSSNRGGANEDTFAARAKLLIPLSSSVDLTLIGDVMDQEAPTYVLTSVPVFDGGGSIIPINFDAVYRPQADRPDIGVDRKTFGLSATLDWDLGDFQLASITAYRELEHETRFDNDATAVNGSVRDNSEDSSQFSQEIRLSQSGERHNLLIGAYAGKDEGSGRFFLDYNIPVPTWEVEALTDLDATNYAVFGQFEYEITDNLKGTVGARYGRDEKDYHYNTRSTLPIIGTFQQTVSRDWDSFDPMVSLAYTLAPDNMIYASYASGYKSGAFQWIARNSVAAQDVAQPEEVDSFEIGYKGLLANGRLQLNATAFHMKYSDLQLLLYRNIAPPTQPDQFVLLTVNAADSTIDGLELDMRALLTDQLSLDFGYAFLDGTYDDFIRELPNGVIQDFSGNPLVRAPRNTFNAALNFSEQYNFGAMKARLSYSWKDDWNHEEDANAINPRSTVEAVGLVDASLAFGFEGGWGITFWGRNLTDERFVQGLINATGSPQQINPSEPRAYGLRLTKAFGGS